jgi:hypothetical protein
VRAGGGPLPRRLRRSFLAARGDPSPNPGGPRGRGWRFSEIHRVPTPSPQFPAVWGRGRPSLRGTSKRPVGGEGPAVCAPVRGIAAFTPAPSRPDGSPDRATGVADRLLRCVCGRQRMIRHALQKKSHGPGPRLTSLPTPGPPSTPGPNRMCVQPAPSRTARRDHARCESAGVSDDANGHGRRVRAGGLREFPAAVSTAAEGPANDPASPPTLCHPPSLGVVHHPPFRYSRRFRAGFRRSPGIRRPSSTERCWI